ncbi:MAG: hypothetical protein IIV84_00950 [Selenomonadales bacterium]|nr:hypothetical protein [Selenomonadales bacterium]
MLSLFYIVLVIAISAVGLLIFLLFRRRISLSIFRARGYFGIGICVLALLALIGCGAAVGIWGEHHRTAPDKLTDIQYETVTDWIDEYASYTKRLERSYRRTAHFLDRVESDALSYQAALYEVDRLTDKALVLKNGFVMQKVPSDLPPALVHRMTKMTTTDTKAYEAYLRLLLSVREELESGAKTSPNRIVSKEDKKKLRLLILDQLPAYTDTHVRLHVLKRDIDDTYRPNRK